MKQNGQGSGYGRPNLALTLIAIWSLFQLGRLSAVSIAQSIVPGDAMSAWLYPAYVDTFIGITAIFIAFAVWRLRGVWVWMIILTWFSISMADHVDAIIAALNAPIPAGFFGGVQSTVLVSLIVGIILDTAVLVTLSRERVKSYFLASMPVNPAAPKPRVTIIVFVVWALFQIPRYIAIPLIQSILAGTDPTEWLNPAIGDVIIATSGFVVLYLFWRKRGLWVWAVALIWLVLSVFDHMSTLTAALVVGSSPKAFEQFGNSQGGAGMFPLIQSVVDVLVFLLVARTSVRSYFAGPSRSAKS
ncbi:MAG: hypothetical protein K8I60_12955 [Anaerolineae bacterium]|nr:hypothetical protein [Anaerolineae bacterium]